MKTSDKRSLVFNAPLTLVALLIAVTISTPLRADEVVHPNDRYHGKTYAEWSARWWEWVMEYPVQDAHGDPLIHPFFEDSDFDVTDGQRGSVWFLASPFGTVERTIQVPENKALFFGMLNAEASDLEGLGATPEERRETAKYLADHIVNVSCTINGSPVENISNFRVASPEFRFHAPTPWIFGETGGRGKSVADGYYLLVRPLPVGTHTIRYTGAFHFAAGELGPDPLEFELDTTYHITVR
jgi:hypothetical protein